MLSSYAGIKYWAQILDSDTGEVGENGLGFWGFGWLWHRGGYAGVNWHGLAFLLLRRPPQCGRFLQVNTTTCRGHGANVAIMWRDYVARCIR